MSWRWIKGYFRQFKDLMRVWKNQQKMLLSGGRRQIYTFWIKNTTDSFCFLNSKRPLERLFKKKKYNKSNIENSCTEITNTLYCNHDVCYLHILKKEFGSFWKKEVGESRMLNGHLKKEWKNQEGRCRMELDLRSIEIRKVGLL